MRLLGQAEGLHAAQSGWEAGGPGAQSVCITSFAVLVQRP